MRQGYFLDSTCDMGIDKGQRHAILAFVKSKRRHGEPPSRPPILADPGEGLFLTFRFGHLPTAWETVAVKDAGTDPGFSYLKNE